MPDFFKTLPKEMIFEIFKKTDLITQKQLAKVNFLFNQVAYDQRLELSIKYFGEKLISAINAKLVQEAINLIQAGADPNYVVKYRQNTALHIAVEQGSYDLACLLVKNGASLKAVNENGDTPLHLAAFRRRGKITRFFIKNGADCYQKNKFQKTPMDLARTSGIDELEDAMWYLNDYSLWQQVHEREEEFESMETNSRIRKIGFCVRR